MKPLFFGRAVFDCEGRGKRSGVFSFLNLAAFAVKNFCKIGKRDEGLDFERAFFYGICAMNFCKIEMGSVILGMVDFRGVCGEKRFQ